MNTALLIVLFSLLGGQAQTPPVQPKAAEPEKAPAAAAADPVVMQTALSVERFYAAKGDFQAKFVQETRQASMPDFVMKKSGQVFFKKPGLMRWDYQEPDKLFYISDGEILWNYIPESSLAYRLEIKGSNLAYALQFLRGEGSLAKEFGLAACERFEDLACLKLLPKTGAQEFKELRLYFKPDFEIQTTILVDPLGNESQTRFLSQRYGTLDPAGFRFQPPKGVRIERLGGKEAAKP